MGSNGSMPLLWASAHLFASDSSQRMSVDASRLLLAMSSGAAIVAACRTRDGMRPQSISVQYTLSSHSETAEVCGCSPDVRSRSNCAPKESTPVKRVPRS